LPISGNFLKLYRITRVNTNNGSGDGNSLEILYNPFSFLFAPRPLLYFLTTENTTKD
jgi:hypothetical protein